MDKNTFILLYKAMVRLHLEYANSLWCPYKKDILQAFRKYKRATNLFIYLKHLSYIERQLKLPTLKYRSLRGDIIEVF